MLFWSFFTVVVSQFTGESYGNSGRPLLGSPKKQRQDLGPTIYEENEVQILTDNDWDENLINFDVYLVLFYTKGTVLKWVTCTWCYKLINGN